MSTRGFLVAVVMAGLLLTVVPGCGSKVSKSNYDKIENGMTLEQVEKILGKGTEEAAGGGSLLDKIKGSGKIVSWKDSDKSITVTFVNGKVTAKVHQGL